jgi:nucleoside-diphosphate-sugar epimerase
MNILITGGRGFVGKAVCDLLGTAEHNIYIVDSHDERVHGEAELNDTYFQQQYGEVPYMTLSAVLPTLSSIWPRRLALQTAWKIHCATFSRTHSIPQSFCCVLSMCIATTPSHAASLLRAA